MAKANIENIGDSYSCTPTERKLLDWLQNETFAVTVGKRDGNPVSTAIPVADMPLNALQAIFAYGVQRKFNDAIGGADKTQEAKLEALREMIEAFKNGEVAKARGTGESVSPEVAARRTVLRPLYKQAWIKANNAEAWKALDEADIVKALDAQYAGLADEGRAMVDARVEAKLEADRMEREAAKLMNVTIAL